MVVICAGGGEVFLQPKGTEASPERWRMSLRLARKFGVGPGTLHPLSQTEITSVCVSLVNVTGGLHSGQTVSVHPGISEELV